VGNIGRARSMAAGDGAARWMAPGFFYRVSDGKPLNEILGLQRLEHYAARPLR